MKTTALSSILAKDLMKSDVVSLRSDATLRSAWQILSQRKISGAPVVDRQGHLVGVVSQQDLVRRILSEGSEAFDKPTFYYALPALSESFIPSRDELREVLETPIDEIMNPYVITVSPLDPLPAVAATMRSHHIHRVIVAEKKKIVGVISTFDLLSLVENQ